MAIDHPAACWSHQTFSPAQMKTRLRGLQSPPTSPAAWHSDPPTNLSSNWSLNPPTIHYLRHLFPHLRHQDLLVLLILHFIAGRNELGGFSASLSSAVVLATEEQVVGQPRQPAIIKQKSISIKPWSYIHSPLLRSLGLGPPGG